MGQFITGTRNMGTEMFTIAGPGLGLILAILLLAPILLLVCLIWIPGMLLCNYCEKENAKDNSWVRHKENGKWVYE